jgi:hypothetical protein
MFASSAPVIMRCPSLSYSSENTGNPWPLNVAWWQNRLARNCFGSLLLLQWLLRASPACCSSCSCGCAAALLGFVTQGASGGCFGTDSEGRAARDPSARRLLSPCRITTSNKVTSNTSNTMIALSKHPEWRTVQLIQQEFSQLLQQRYQFSDCKQPEGSCRAFGNSM